MQPVKAYKYKLKANTKFVAGCSATLNVCCELYNAALQERRDAYQINGLSINYHAQAVQLPQIKQVREDVGEVHSQVLQDTLRRVKKAFDAFFRRCRNGETPGYPRFVRRSKLSDMSGERRPRSLSGFHPNVPA
jgi:putative transposase